MRERVRDTASPTAAVPENTNRGCAGNSVLAAYKNRYNCIYSRYMLYSSVLYKYIILFLSII